MWVCTYNYVGVAYVCLYGCSACMGVGVCMRVCVQTEAISTLTTSTVSAASVHMGWRL